MAEPYAVPGLPERMAVVRALAQLEFEFDVEADGRRADRIVGFAPESVVEVIEGPPLMVSLLFSASEQRKSLIRSTMSVVTLASVLGVDFTEWLSRQIEQRGLASPWRSTRRFGWARVSAELMSRDAVLLVIQDAARA